MLSSAARSRLAATGFGGVGKLGGWWSRAMCAAAETTRIKNALMILGLEPGATPRDIKMRYYDLAKRTHPDVLAQQQKAAEAAPKPVGPVVASFTTGVLDERVEVTAVPFLEVQAAYDALMQAEEEAGDDGKRKRGTAPGARPARARSIGEVLCDRLKDEPEAMVELWSELKHQRIVVTASMADTIVKACAQSGGGGIEMARAILREGTALSIISQDVRGATLISLLNWVR